MVKANYVHDRSLFNMKCQSFLGYVSFTTSSYHNINYDKLFCKDVVISRHDKIIRRSDCFSRPKT